MIKIDETLERNIDIMRTSLSVCKNIDDAQFVSLDTDVKEKTKNDFYKKYDNWYLLDDELYYIKRLKSMIAIINELVGEHLSIYMGLPTINYDIALEEGKIIGLISKNFINPDYDYIKGICISRSLRNYIREIVTSKDIKCDEQLKRQLTSYILRNYYSALRDRTNNTLYAQTTDEKFILAPLFDYESSFMDPEMLEYLDPIISWTFTPESVQYLKENNEYFKEYVNMILDYNLKDALSDIEEQRKICIPNRVKQYYMEFDNKRKEHMSRYGLHRLT